MYEVFDHTADLGLRIRAARPDELFVEAARGLISLIVANPEQIRLVESRTLNLQGDDREYLLFDWLSELLYLFETERFLPNRFEVRLQPDGVSATCEGELLDHERHELEHEVKAITYHGLKVESSADGWLAEVIVDI